MENSLLFLSPEVRSDDQPVHYQVDDQWPHGGIEDSAGEQLVCQVDGEEVGLTGPVQPARTQEQTRRTGQVFQRGGRELSPSGGTSQQPALQV